MWIKYKQSYSAGTNKEWTYCFVPDYLDRKGIEGWLEEFGNLDMWSEHYRGVEWHKVKKLPKKVLQEFIKDTQSTIRSQKQHLVFLKQQHELYYGSVPDSITVPKGVKS
jgi:hypothetical protein